MMSGNSKYHTIQTHPPIRDETPGQMSKTPFIRMYQKVEAHPRQCSENSSVKQMATVRALPSKHQLMYKNVPLPSKHTLVDGLVLDYLHFAQYGHTIPVYEGSSTSTCFCCTDRNRENVCSILGFRNTEDNKKDSYEEVATVPSRAMSVPIPVNPTGRSWMAYQPLPYASNYLNPEFNRATAVHSYLEETSARNNLISEAVIDAGSKYDLAMKKLQGFGRESRTNKLDNRARTPD